MTIDIVRAWKDAKYRESLTEEQLAQLPQNPVGEVELKEADLDINEGNALTSPICTFYGTRCQ